MNLFSSSLGAGKTGIDAVLFLLNQNVEADKITWIIPNDPWLINRDKFKDLENMSLTNMTTLVRYEILCRGWPIKMAPLIIAK